MAQLKYQSRTVESTTDGVTTIFSYFGTREELLALQNAGRPGISPEPAPVFSYPDPAGCCHLRQGLSCPDPKAYFSGIHAPSLPT